MKRAFISIILYTFALTIAVVLGLFFYREPDTAIPMAADNRAAILTIFTAFIVGPIWVGYNRLSQLDKLENLSGRQKDEVHAFSKRARETLLGLFFPTGAVILLALILLTAAQRVPYAPYVFAAAMPALFLFFVRSLNILRTVLHGIEVSIAEAIRNQSKQAAREKLIASLKKGRSESPLKEDAHLSAYRNLLESRPQTQSN